MYTGKHKKQFVENQKMTVYKLKNGMYLNSNRHYEFDNNGVCFIVINGKTAPISFYFDTNISGTYFTKDDIAYIEGTRSFSFSDPIYSDKLSSYYNPKISPSEYIYKGLFKLSDIFNTELAELYFYKGYVKYDGKNGRYEVFSVTLQKQSEGYMLKIEYDNRILEAVVSSDAVKKHGVKIDSFLASSQNVKISYKNGDVFVGTVQGKGEYKFATGEKYTGTCKFYNIGYNEDIAVLFYYDNYDKRIIIPSDGVTTFADGTTATGDWLKQYENNKWEVSYIDEKGKQRNEWERIDESCKTLTEIRNMAAEKHRKLQEKIITWQC